MNGWTKDFGMVWGCQMAGTEHLRGCQQLDVVDRD